MRCIIARFSQCFYRILAVPSSYSCSRSEHTLRNYSFCSQSSSSKFVPSSNSKSKHEEGTTTSMWTCGNMEERKRSCIFLYYFPLVSARREISTTSFNFMRKGAELSEQEYNRFADETLESLNEFLDRIPERCGDDCDPNYDVTCSMGVLTVNLGAGGTYVINKQTPNKQIWLSSPISGPKRYDFCNGTWIYAHSGESLHRLLTKELRKNFPSFENLDFSSCAFGKEAV